MPSARLYDRPVSLPRDEQIAAARREIRQAATVLGHELADWRVAGLVADDEAICGRCGLSVLLVYGDAVDRPLQGMRRVGAALKFRCVARPKVR